MDFNMEEGKLVRPEGFDFQILQALASHLEFKFVNPILSDFMIILCIIVIKIFWITFGSYTLRTPPDNTWGALVNDTWTGAVGVLVRKEADAAFANLALMEDRFNDVDFSCSYFVDPVVFVTPISKTFVYGIRTVTIFLPEVWIYLGCSVLGLASSFLLIHKVLGGLLEVNSSYSQTIYNCLAGKYTFQPFCRLICLRLVQVSFWLGLLVIQAAFSSQVTSQLNVPFYEEPVSTIEQLLRLVRKGSRTVAAVNFTDIYRFMRNDRSGLYWELGAGIRKEPLRFGLNNNQQGLEMLARNPKIVLTGGLTGIQALTSVFGSTEFHFSEDQFYSLYMSIGYPKESMLKDLFHRPLMSLVENGLVKFWLYQALENRALPFRKQREESDSSEEGVPRNGKRLSPQDLRGPFQVLTSGVIFSILTFVIEVACRVYVYWIEKERMTLKSI